jgi:hypothetical protein
MLSSLILSWMRAKTVSLAEKECWNIPLSSSLADYNVSDLLTGKLAVRALIGTEISRPFLFIVQIYKL